MRTIVVLGVASAMLLSGCASTSEGIALNATRVDAGRGLGSRWAGSRCGRAHQPLGGGALATEGDAIVVRFARPGRLTAVARLDSTSLDELFHDDDEPVDPSPVDARPGPTVLEGGRFIVCWKMGDAERGYRALAQAFNTADGSPQGAPVVISPHLPSTSSAAARAPDRRHRAVATFEASIGESFALFAVSIEVI